MSRPPTRPRRRVPRTTIGWREWVSFPELGVDAIKAKVDTGARTSALHAHRLRVVETDAGPVARFEIHPIQKRRTPSIPAELPITDWRNIRSSNGLHQRRPVVVTELVAGDERWEVELTLTSRDEMGFRLLLGRTAIGGRFLVDVSRSYLLGRPDAVQPSS
ncbi:MAG: RimK/LysX family protein [Acidimicrobiia bacterium]